MSVAVIAGSRDFFDPKKVESAITDAIRTFGPVSKVLCGCASGVDAFGHAWAVSHDIPVEHFPADWDKHGRAAGPIRNRAMARACDFGIIVWDGSSPGTRNMIGELRRYRKPFYVTYTGV